MTADTLAPDTRLRRADSAVDADVAGLTVMMDFEAGNYYGLNEVGTYLWQRLDAPHTVAELAADLPRHFEVEADEAERATRAFLADLLARGLVVHA